MAPLPQLALLLGAPSKKQQRSGLKIENAKPKDLRSTQPGRAVTEESSEESVEARSQRDEPKALQALWHWQLQKLDAALASSKVTEPLPTLMTSHQGWQRDMCSASTPPKNLFGLLAKQSPKALAFGSYQKRFFILQEGVLYWSASGAALAVGPEGPPGCKGRVDFTLNLGCEVSVDESSSTKFSLRPMDGRWSAGDFTGSESGRAFHFDTLGGAPSRDQWLTAFRAHVAFGKQRPERADRLAALRCRVKALGALGAARCDKFP